MFQDIISLLCMSRIGDRYSLPAVIWNSDTSVVHFSLTVLVETVALLSKLDVDKHISVKIELDELDLTSVESKATYAQIKEYIRKICFESFSTLYCPD